MIYDFRTIATLGKEAIKDMDYDAYSLDDLLKFDLRTVMQIFRETDLLDVARIYYSSNDQTKELILNTNSPMSCEMIKEMKLPPCTDEEYNKLAAVMKKNIKTALTYKCQGILNGTEDVLRI